MTKLNLSSMKKEPIEVYKKQRKDTHKMVEEYMLLANKIVAEEIITLEKEEKKIILLFTEFMRGT